MPVLLPRAAEKAIIIGSLEMVHSKTRLTGSEVPKYSSCQIAAWRATTSVVGSRGAISTQQPGYLGCIVSQSAGPRSEVAVDIPVSGYEGMRVVGRHRYVLVEINAVDVLERGSVSGYDGPIGPPEVVTGTRSL